MAWVREGDHNMLVSAFFPEQLASYTGPASPWYVPSYTVAAQNGLLTGSDVERTPQGEAVEQSVNHLKDMMLLDTIPAAPLRARSPRQQRQCWPDQQPGDTTGDDPPD